MKFSVDVDGRREELQVMRRRDAAGGERLIITRNGQTLELRVVYRDGPQFVLEYEQAHGEHVQRRRLRAVGYSDGDERQLWVNGSNLHYKVVRRSAAAASTEPVAAAGALSTSIPAVVSEVLVAVGDNVSAGQKLILLESMKMILPIQAPHDGIVSAIHCQPGEAVQPGKTLIEIGD